MKPLPYRLKQLRFTALSVQPKKEPAVIEPSTARSEASVDGLQVTIALEHSFGDKDDPNEFGVSMVLTIGDEEENSTFPYRIKVGAIGYFQLAQSLRDEVAREDLAFVGGASHLYSAIRDELASITARHWYGQVNIPPLSFSDDRPSLRKQNQEGSTPPSESDGSDA